MRVATKIGFALFALAPFYALAQEPPGAPEAEPLKLRTKYAPAAPTPLARAPFVAVPGEPPLDLLPREEDPRLKASRSSCSHESRSLCYDSGTNKIVYKGTREYMPDLPGLRREHISVRKDRVTFKYSFR